VLRSNWCSSFITGQSTSASQPATRSYSVQARRAGCRMNRLQPVERALCTGRRCDGVTAGDSAHTSFKQAITSMETGRTCQNVATIRSIVRTPFKRVFAGSQCRQPLVAAGDFWVAAGNSFVLSVQASSRT